MNGTATPAPAPGPIQAALDADLERMLANIPSGKRGQAAATVSTAGIEVGVGYRPRENLRISGYAGRLWGGAGWTAGARAQIVW